MRKYHRPALHESSSSITEIQNTTEHVGLMNEFFNYYILAHIHSLLYGQDKYRPRDFGRPFGANLDFIYIFFLNSCLGLSFC